MVHYGIGFNEGFPTLHPTPPPCVRSRGRSLETRATRSLSAEQFLKTIKGSERHYLDLTLVFYAEDLVWFGIFLQLLACQNTFAGGSKPSAEAGGCQLGAGPRGESQRAGLSTSETTTQEGICC